MAVLVADPLPMDGTPLHYRRPSPRPGNSLFHVEVPPGTTALTVQAKYSASQAFSIWLAQDPTGRELPFNPYGSELYAFDPETVTGEIGRANVELQSLMRISYAVFCLTKKKTT